MFSFKVIKKSNKNMARRGKIITAHSTFETPIFMPCATVGAVKGISAEELESIGFKIILGNTYHLYLRPGEKLIKKFGKLQKFMHWPGAILTDSGGYQVFSLGAAFEDYQDKNKPKKSLVKITKNGVWFKSHLDGSKHLFTPEKVIDIQKNLGSDIIMVLDECTPYPATYEQALDSMNLTHNWAKKAIEYWQKNPTSDQAVFGIVQGSVYQKLREESTKYISSLGFDGIAVGGVSVGEGKDNMYKVLNWVKDYLPQNKPHYLMGVGEPEDIIKAVEAGFDMFDCVLPTRLGRHGTIWTTSNWKTFSKVDLRKSQYKTDKKILMKNCGCPTCSKGYSRAYISHLICNKEMLGMRLTSLHNLWLLQELTRRIRESI